MGEKSLLVTYLLWLVFGWFGVHHLYLRRDRQAFLWCSTFGGFFWLGWARDFWRIPDYVEDANEDEYYMEQLSKKMKYRQQPQFNTSRFTGQVIIGSFYGTLVRLACPEESAEWIIALGVSLGIACGVYLVGNVGREKGPFGIPYIATLLTYLGLYLMTGEEPGYVNCSIITALTFTFYREWRTTPTGKYEKETTRKRATKLSVKATLVLALWASFLYFNATITYESGEKIKLTDSIVHFFKSPVWLDFRSTFWTLYVKGESKEWQNFYDDVVQSFDPTGERNARAVLGVDQDDASEDIIRRQYKKLIFQWHPDRYKGDDTDMAQKKFIEIQQAYELLQNRMKRKNHSTYNKSHYSSTSHHEREKTEF